MSKRQAILTFFLGWCVLAFAGSDAHSQEAAAPELYREAESRLARADTLGALAALLELTEAEAEYAAGWGLLGMVLAEKAGGVATDFLERQQAEKALKRALTLDPGNPAYLAALAKLMRKQQIYLDARRVLGRAVDATEERPEAISGRALADLLFEQGLYHEDQYLDTWHLMFAPNLPVGGPCREAPTFCLNFDDPRAFNEYLIHASDLSEFAEDDFRRMEEAFREALSADPSHAKAFRRLAIHLVDRGEYRDAIQLAELHEAAAPASPWSHLVLGLVRQRMGNDSLAEVEFDRGLALAPPEIAEHYRDVSLILREDQAEAYSRANEAARRRVETKLWRQSDPLYLTEENEVRVEHLARVAFADVMYEDPSEGIWGSDTEQGAIYVRYGPPLRIWKIRRDASRELTAGDLAALEAGPPFEPRQTTDHGGGRWIFWNYGSDVPNFIFQRQLRYRRAKHVFSSASKAWEEELRERHPAHYRTVVIEIPVQVARFRGATEDEVAVEVHSELPLEGLAHDIDLETGSIETGLFLLDPDGDEVFREVEEAILRYEDSSSRNNLRSWRVILPPGGELTAAVEVHDRTTDRAAAARATFFWTPFPNDSLSVSDILLAERVRPLAADPLRRGDYDVIPNPGRRYSQNQAVHLYYEVYGLRADGEGYASYEVSLAVKVRSLRRGGGIEALLGLLADTWGFSVVGDDRVELRYEREVMLEGHDRAIEYLSLDLGKAPAGEYEIELKVWDRQQDRVAGRTRTFTVVE